MGKSSSYGRNPKNFVAMQLQAHSHVGTANNTKLVIPFNCKLISATLIHHTAATGGTSVDGVLTVKRGSAGISLGYTAPVAQDAAEGTKVKMEVPRNAEVVFDQDEILEFSNDGNCDATAGSYGIQVVLERLDVTL